MKATTEESGASEVPALIAAWLKVLRATAAGRPDGPELSRMADALARAGRLEPDLPPPPPPHVALRHLPAALSGMEACPHPALISAVRAVLPAMRWTTAYEKAGETAAMADLMVAAQAAGGRGPWRLDDISFGLFLIAPGAFYPRHWHEAKEIYFILAGEIEIALNDNPALLCRPGSLVRTPSNAPHTLKAGPRPVLILYHWVDAIGAPIWFAEPGEAPRGHGMGAKPDPRN
jgi:mannose-6-phosphate isomerase-like protein (cupin superfamily)